ncbi:hypothetical protein FRB94_011406 [Tulasnella sp. JGI-2019a]|nr:hypothetical protein FRB93_002998 [Tulasnella sp. JGI-2019a]KAG8992656.1 hypothetical protein FRB94_011406 [Tulasnella sp. JGI-2019a]KAG9026961.1 hypothetical protein FRB95_008299 [Tulasnella sp. JGI-2019a]
MNSASTIHLDIVLERPQSKDVMRALLHAILFHRLFGTIKPQTIDVLDVTFPGVSDPEIESQVNAKVDALWRALDSIPGGNNVIKKGQIIVVLSEKRPKTKWFSISMGEEEVAWEQWVVTIELLPARQSSQSQSNNSNYYTSKPIFTKPQFPPTPNPTDLNQTLLQILTHVSSNQGRDAVPPIMTNTGISPFPLRIDVLVGDRMIR